MSLTISIAPVRKSVVVAAEPAQAFEVFTAGIDRWWPKSHGLGSSPIRESVIEGYRGGRWYSKCEDGSEVSTGRVLVWEPPHRVVFSWDVSPQWKPDTRTPSEVEIRFIAEGPGSTRVELEHRNFERLGEEGGAKLRKDVDSGWPTLIDLYAQEVGRGAR